MSYQPPPFPTSSTPNPHHEPQLSDHSRSLIIRERELDLQIATERRKEREAELEILRLRSGQGGLAVGAGYGGGGGGGGGGDVFGVGIGAAQQGTLTGLGFDGSINFSNYPMDQSLLPSLPNSHAAAPSQPLSYAPAVYPQSSYPTSPPIPYNPSITAGAQGGSNFLSPDFFNWLPEDPSIPPPPPPHSENALPVTGYNNSEEDLRILESMFGTGSHLRQASQPPQLEPHDSLDILNPQLLKSAFPNGLPSAHPSPTLPLPGLPPASSQPPPPTSTPQSQTQAPAPLASSSTHPTPPSSSHPKKVFTKKDLHTLHASCLTCSQPVAKLLIKTSSALVILRAGYRCLGCADLAVVGRKRAGKDGPGSGVGRMGSVAGRKRVRQEEEVAEAAETWGGKGKGKEVVKSEDGAGGDSVGGRCICDVCQRVVGVGRVERERKAQAGSGGREDWEGDMAVEVICAGCDGKYSR